MKKLLVVSIAIIVLFAVAVLPAAAGWTWCSSDPHVKLPDNSLVQLWVSVPEGFEGETVALQVWAPEGSQVIGGNGRLDVTVDLGTVRATDKMKIAVHEDFPVRIDARRQGESLGEFTFEAGHGVATWTW